MTHLTLHGNQQVLLKLTDVGECKSQNIDYAKVLDMFKIYRDMSLCNECSRCFKHLPKLEHGPITMAEWVLQDGINSLRIDKAITSCETGAIDIVKV